MNQVLFIGKISGESEFSHFSKGEEFRKTHIAVRRLSGSEDYLRLIFPASLASSAQDETDVEINGSLCSYNNASGQGSKLVISILADRMEPSDKEHTNIVRLRGTVCKAPVFRHTPLGREISDVMLAVQRETSRSDYLPIIAWGLEARKAADFTVGSIVEVEGRFQSRKYIKMLNGEPTERLAYEISASAVAAAVADS